MKNTVLVVAAHPDDEILGCGGTMARLADEGHVVYTLILGEGVTSRDDERDSSLRSKELELLKDTARLSNKTLGVKEVFFGDLPDNRFDSVSLLDVVKKVESVIEKVNPAVVFTHFEGDLNVDHQVTCRAVKTATRPLEDSSVREVLSFSVLSSTEWNYGGASFSPNLFYDISSTVDRKVAAMAVYNGELREWPHPRSLKAIEHEACLRGSYVGCEAAESFMALRLLR